MDTQQLIGKLTNSGLHAICPCGEEFMLKDALLFDGTKPFPAEAIEIQKDMLETLKDRRDELKEMKKKDFLPWA